MNKRQKKKLFKGDILRYLHKYIDPISDDAEWERVECEVIIDYCDSKNWRFTENDLDVFNIRGIDIDVLAHYYSDNGRWSKVR